jgi:hypothetical protein
MHPRFRLFFPLLLPLPLPLPVFLLFLLSSSSHAAPPTSADFAGRWELLLTGTGDTFRASSLVLAEKDGGLQGELVWRWGSVVRLESADIKRNDAGELLVSARDLPAPLTIRRRGDLLEGTLADKDGKTISFSGIRAAERVDPTGTWEVRVQTSEGEKTGVLAIHDQGAGRYRAEATGADGHRPTVSAISLAGNVLTIEVQPGEGGALRLVAELRGDRLAGELAGREGGNPFKVTGERRRSWGAPVSLLPQQGLAGWKPRDPAQKFGWTCEGGVLTNAPPDVDIQSELEFQDFKLHLEYKVSKRGNSGVYLRGRYEVQILDDHGRGSESHGNGAVYSRIPQSRNVSREPETWQTYDITLVGRHVTVVLNGETIIDNARLEGITGGALLPYESLPGPLMLQGDHGKVWYRNITVTPALPAAAAAPASPGS